MYDIREDIKYDIKDDINYDIIHDGKLTIPTAENALHRALSKSRFAGSRLQVQDVQNWRR
jgi:hypothetical protein